MIQLSTGNPEWQRTVAGSEITIGEAIEILNKSSLRIVLITDAEGVLQGTISDGDIRRGLLKGLSLSSSINEIIQYKPKVVTDKASLEEVKFLMSSNKISQIPITDESNRLRGLHVWDQLESLHRRANPFVIMAGGKGTRLLPKTERIPKPMLDVAGKPILEHIISRARGEGFYNFLIAIHHLGNVVEDYFGNGEDMEVTINYLREETPLGTAGALGLVESISALPYIVTNGDVISDVQYGGILDFHQKNQASATMVVRHHQHQFPFGVVQTNGIEIVEYEEKPIIRSLVNAGIYVLDPKVLELVDKNVELNMPTLFELVNERGMRTVAYPIHESWMDLGDHATLASANEIISDR